MHASLIRKQKLYRVAHKTFFLVEISIASGTLIPDLEWNGIKNPYRRDRFLIVLKLTKPDECYPQVPIWKVDSGDWTQFRELAVDLG